MCCSSGFWSCQVLKCYLFLHNSYHAVFLLISRLFNWGLLGILSLALFICQMGPFSHVPLRAAGAPGAHAVCLIGRRLSAARDTEALWPHLLPCQLRKLRLQFLSIPFVLMTKITFATQRGSFYARLLFASNFPFSLPPVSHLSPFETRSSSFPQEGIPGQSYRWIWFHILSYPLKYMFLCGNLNLFVSWKTLLLPLCYL